MLLTYRLTYPSVLTISSSAVLSRVIKGILILVRILTMVVPALAVILPSICPIACSLDVSNLLSF